MLLWKKYFTLPSYCDLCVLLLCAESTNSSQTQCFVLMENIYDDGVVEADYNSTKLSHRQSAMANPYPI